MPYDTQGNQHDPYRDDYSDALTDAPTPDDKGPLDALLVVAQWLMFVGFGVAIAWAVWRARQ